MVATTKKLKQYPKPVKFDYNLVVIGAGSGGLVSAITATSMKARVALIERHKMGGDCLNTGCVPSKAIIRSAKVAALCVKASDFGIINSKVGIDFSKVMGRVHNTIAKIEPHDSTDRFTKLGVECLSGDAKIKSPYTVEVNGKILTTKAIVVATGGAPLVPDIHGLKDTKFYTSDTIWEITELPKRLVVLGGGPIGVELAQSFVRLGSNVTLIDKGAQLLFKEDQDSAEVVAASLKSDGVNLLLNHQIKSFRIEEGDTIATAENNLELVETKCDAVLVCLGRIGRGAGFGLEELGIKINKNGTIEHDEKLRTSIPNIFVCGDVAGPFQFTHTASYQAFIASFNAMMQPFWTFKTDYRVIPWCTFTDPELARVGLSENEAKAKGLDFTVTKYQLDDLDRAIAESETKGFVKVITAGKSDKILGATIVGAHAGELIIEFILAMKHGLGLSKILSTIHIYPTFVEANRFVAGQWRRANAPAYALEILNKFHLWRRS